MASLAGQITLGVGPSTKGFWQKFRVEIKRDVPRVDVPVSANTKSASAQLAAWRKLQEANKVNIGVKVDRRQLDTFHREFKRIEHTWTSSALKKAIRVQIYVVGAAALPSLAQGALSAATALTQLGQSALVLPGIFSGVAATVGTLLTGLHGLGRAFSEAGKGVKVTNTEINTYHRAALKVANAQRDLEKATLDAKRAIEDQGQAMRDTYLDKAQAAINVEKARQELLKTADKSALDRQQDALDYNRALSDQIRVNRDANRTVQDGTKLLKDGVTNSNTYQDAMDNLSNSLDRFTEAQNNVNGMTDGFIAAMKNLSPAARDFVTQVLTVKDAWIDLTNSVQGTLLDGLGTEIVNLANKRLPLLKQSMQQVAGSLNTVFKSALQNLGSDANAANIQKIFSNTAAAINLAAPGINSFVNAFLHLSEVGSRFLPRLSNAFDDVMKRFENFVDRADKDGSLERWIDKGLNLVSSLGRSILDIGSILNSVSEAYEKATGNIGGLATTLEGSLGKLAGFLASPAGQQKLVNFIQKGRDFIDTVKNALPGLIDGFQTFTEGVRQYGSVAFPILSGVGTFLEKHAGVLKYIVGLYLALKTVKPVFNTIGKGFSAATSGAAKYRDAVARVRDEESRRASVMSDLTRYTNAAKVADAERNIHLANGLGASQRAAQATRDVASAQQHYNSMVKYYGQTQPSTLAAQKNLTDALVRQKTAAANVTTAYAPLGKATETYRANTALAAQASERLGGPTGAFGRMRNAITGGNGLTGLLGKLGSAVGGVALSIGSIAATGTAMWAMYQWIDAQEKATQRVNAHKDAVNELHHTLSDSTGAFTGAAADAAAESLQTGTITGTQNKSIPVNALEAAGKLGFTGPQVISAVNPTQVDLRNKILTTADENTKSRVSASDDNWKRFGDQLTANGCNLDTYAKALNGDQDAVKAFNAARDKMFNAQPAILKPLGKDTLANQGRISSDLGTVTSNLVSTTPGLVLGQRLREEAGAATSGGELTKQKNTPATTTAYPGYQEAYITPSGGGGVILPAGSNADAINKDGTKGQAETLPDGRVQVTLTRDEAAKFLQKKQGFAGGGPVWGMGSATSDSIPAYLSNGEFVLNSDAAKFWGGGMLHAMNDAPHGFSGGGWSAADTRGMDMGDLANGVHGSPSMPDKRYVEGIPWWQGIKDLFGFSGGGAVDPLQWLKDHVGGAGNFNPAAKIDTSRVGFAEGMLQGLGKQRNLDYTDYLGWLEDAGRTPPRMSHRDLGRPRPPGFSGGGGIGQSVLQKPSFEWRLPYDGHPPPTSWTGGGGGSFGPPVPPIPLPGISGGPPSTFPEAVGVPVPTTKPVGPPSVKDYGLGALSQIASTAGFGWGVHPALQNRTNLVADFPRALFGDLTGIGVGLPGQDSGTGLGPLRPNYAGPNHGLIAARVLSDSVRGQHPKRGPSPWRPSSPKPPTPGSGPAPTIPRPGGGPPAPPVIVPHNGTTSRAPGPLASGPIPGVNVPAAPGVIPVGTGVPDGHTGDEAGLQTDTLKVKRAVESLFPQISTIGGVRPDALKWHPNGLAADVMLPGGGGTPDDKATAASVLQYFSANAGQFGIDYIIYDGQIYSFDESGKSDGGKPYDGSNPHTDHLHINTRGGGFPSGAATISPDGTTVNIPLPDGTVAQTPIGPPPQDTTTPGSSGNPVQDFWNGTLQGPHGALPLNGKDLLGNIGKIILDAIGSFFGINLSGIFDFFKRFQAKNEPASPDAQANIDAYQAGAVPGLVDDGNGNLVPDTSNSSGSNAAPTITGASSTKDIAGYIYNKALASGYSKEDAALIVSQAFGESSLNPGISGGVQKGAEVVGIFQEKSEFADNATRDQLTDPKFNIDKYFEKLLQHRDAGDVVDQLAATSQGGPAHPSNGGRAYISALRERVRQLYGFATGGPVGVGNAAGQGLSSPSLWWNRHNGGSPTLEQVLTRDSLNQRAWAEGKRARPQQNAEYMNSGVLGHATTSHVGPLGLPYPSNGLAGMGAARGGLIGFKDGGSTEFDPWDWLGQNYGFYDQFGPTHNQDPQLNARGGMIRRRRYDRGGHVRGPGSKTSDSIPAMLSNGEFVMRTDATRFWGGGMLDYMNKAPHLADGGFPDIPGIGDALTKHLQPPGPLPLGQDGGIGNAAGAQLSPEGAAAQRIVSGIGDAAGAVLAPKGSGGSGWFGGGDGSNPSGGGPQGSGREGKDPRSTLGAGPATNSHINPALKSGIEGAFSTIGSLAGTAASIALNGVAPGAGSAAGAGIQAGAQIAGQVASGWANVLSSLLVGTVTGGTTGQGYGAPLLPGAPQPSPTVNNVDNSSIVAYNPDEAFRLKERKDNQRAVTFLNRTP